MKSGYFLMSALALGIALSGCTDSFGQISGNVTVAKGFDGKEVHVVLWQVPAAPSDPTNPNSELVATPGQAPVLITDTPIGVVSSGGGSFPYTFHTLDRGLYIVGAFLDTPTNPTPDLNNDVNSIDQNNPIEINPTDNSKRSVKRDLFLGMSDPSLGTITGTVHRSARAASVPIALVVLSSNPYTSNAQLLIQQAVTGTGSDVPFQIFNTPLTPVYVMAIADINQNGQLDLNQDLVSMALENPVTVDPMSHAASGVDLWLDQQSPTLGSVNGTVALSAPLDTASVTVLAFSTDFNKDLNANVIGVANATATSTAQVPFMLTSMPVGANGMPGTIYLYVLTETHGLVTAQVTAQTPYMGTSTTDAAPVTTNPGQATMVTIPVGVGRVTGTVQLSNAPSDITTGWVLATQTVGMSPVLRQFAQVAISAGNSTQSYEVFGLLDGKFDMTFLPDLSKTGSLSANDPTQGVIGSPSPVTITAGSPQVSDFTYSFH